MREVLVWFSSLPTGLRFLLVGGINTLFGYSVYAVLVLLLVPYALALFLALVFGVVFNYFTTGGLVFDALDSAVAPRFVFAYGVLYLLNLGLLSGLVWLGVGKLVAQGICLLVVAPTTFVVLKTFVFSKCGDK